MEMRSFFGIGAILSLISVAASGHDLSDDDPDTLSNALRDALLQIGLSKEGKTVDWNDYPRGRI